MRSETGKRSSDVAILQERICKSELLEPGLWRALEARKPNFNFFFLSLFLYFCF